MPDDVARALTSEMTQKERLWCLDGDAPTWAGVEFLANDGYHMAPFLAGRVERIGLPGISFADGPRGCVVGNATCFPVSMARGATWDPDLEEQVGQAIGRETRALGATLSGAVCVNLLRHPAWGRAQETYGEDPFHVGEMGAALTRGLQEHVMACVKHFACNSIENARFSVDVKVDEVALHEIYLPQFRRIVDEGVACVMSAYNSVNGQWCGQNHNLLTETLRDEWGFLGFTISDWIFGIRDATLSLAAGLDIEMPYRMIRAQHLETALASTKAIWDDVDQSVQRIVSTLLRFDSVLSTPPPAVSQVGCRAHRELARNVAAKSVVVLKNSPVDGKEILPLEDIIRVGVIGQLANVANLGDSGSSDVWDPECTSVLDALRHEFLHVVYDDGSNLERSAQICSQVDAVIVVVGYSYLDEGEYIGASDPELGALFPESDDQNTIDRFKGWIAQQPVTTKPDRLFERPRGFGTGGDRTSLRLPDSQVDLISTVADSNPRTIVVIQSGSAVITTEWIDKVPAVLMAWYGGCQAGPGLVDALVGNINPSARLPFSIPKDEADLPPFDSQARAFTYDRWHGWWHLMRNGTSPHFPFGFGLSYTSFRLESCKVTTGDLISIEGTLSNTGPLDGTDVIQVYVHFPDPDTPPRLVGFSNIKVAPGQVVSFEISIPKSRLARRDPGLHHWTQPSGPHLVRVGRYCGDPQSYTCELEL